jgi:hypothetical protein
MKGPTFMRTNWRVCLFLLSGLLLAACLLTANASAVPVSSTPTHNHRTRTSQSIDGIRILAVAQNDANDTNDAYMQLVPGAPGNCPAPPNGGTTNVGCRFTLQLMVNSGSSNSVSLQQSYLSFTYKLLQNAAVSSIGSGCVLTNIVTPDTSSFEAILQNEVCNGPDPCIFHGVTIDPGSIAYASTTFGSGRGGTFLVAQIGVCATAPGRAVLHWQFSPPAPPERSTGIMDGSGWMHNPELFADYVINIEDVTSTPQPTVTPGGPPTDTATPTPTNTRTPIPPITATPPPCGLAWRGVDSPSPSLIDNHLFGVATVSANDVWAVGGYNTTAGNTLTEHWNGTQWAQVPSPNAGDSLLIGAAAVSANDVWAVGYSLPNEALTEHWNGNQWSIVPAAPITQGTVLRSVAAISTNDVWAVGYYLGSIGGVGVERTLIEHWDGMQWNMIPSPNANADRNNELWDITTVSANDVWAVGYYTADDAHITQQSLFLHWNGSQWSIVPSPGVPGSYHHRPHGMSAISANDIWTVGFMDGGSYSLHWDGTQWGIVLTPYFGDLEGIYSVKALSANSVWAVGNYFPTPSQSETLVLHWDGHAWTQVPSPSPGERDNHLERVGATSSTSVWAVGYQWNGFGTPFLTLIEHYADPCSGITPTPSSTATTTVATTTATNTATATATSTVAATAITTPTATRTPIPSPTPTHTPARVATSTPTGMVTVTPCPMTFIDVHTTDYFYQPVRYLYCRGVISGYSDNTFRPYNTTTRGQLSKIVTLGFGTPIYTPPTPTFNDVPITDPFYQYIETAYHSLLVSGYTCGGAGEPCPGLYFRPGNNVTRGQLSKIVVVAERWPLLDPSTATFQDVPVGSTFFRYVETAYSHSIISGYSCGGPGEPCPGLYFRPGNSATRGQISKIVYQAITQP